MRPIVVTGGAGFIGSNLTDRLASSGVPVVVVDTLARPGVERNLAWLKERHGDRVLHHAIDVREGDRVRRVIAGAQAVYHFAAQVAVTTSLSDPREDFEVNALGTFNVLEAVRLAPEPPPLVFTSTNKVYGALPDVALADEGARYAPVDEEIRIHGVDERRPLDFHSPYGCSKGAADQYVLDYARSFGLPAVVFRMSCIYGPRQFGTEDQGWVAHFVRRALEGAPLTLYGDGKQVRDVLYVGDLVDALLQARAGMRFLKGRAFNVGGGPGSTISLLDLLERIERLTGRRPQVTHADWRTGDQRYYVSDTRALARATGWRPSVGVEEGLARLHRWLLSSVVGVRGEETGVEEARA